MEWLTRGSSFYSSMTKGLGSQCRVRLAPHTIHFLDSLTLPHKRNISI